MWYRKHYETAFLPDNLLYTKPFFLILLHYFERKMGLVQPESKQLKINHTLFKVKVTITKMSITFVPNNR